MIDPTVKKNVARLKDYGLSFDLQLFPTQMKDTFVHRNDPEVIGTVVDNAIEILGSDRLMFGSNFPIEKLWTSHAELIAAHRKAVARHGQKAEGDIFWSTAERIYRPA